ncbi:MAG: hypothetical protein DBX06_05545 [Candidatus Poseidoniales archaeon]|jgi:hypothetical protein|nr:hypothetical protein [Candidatus Poseidoniales archaeon]MDC0183401.1 hypothetical protein [Candidatus Poseidoniales archaeon]RCH71257.1 MAG: hypothetical protein DBX06_06750 [Candidatus Poseidoniales archaeon]RCH71484.1 MAG: hypothetical protein DBX06_05545 [Candidatus Poseidoniales archaeon]|tara:strand:+ start:1949 stop:2575 length:627 start_codon:yes stop_codon:yes gene_type:complete
MSDEDNIRFSFRSNEQDVEVVIQGPPSWVNLYRERIGLDGDIGYTQSVSGALEEEIDGAPNAKKVNQLPGPPPDPSRLPSVVRVIGDLDIEAGLDSLGAPARTEPDLAEISIFLDELEEMPEPLSDNMSGDPMAESWIQLVMTLVVREHGHTSLSLGSIESLLGERVNRSGIELQMFLDRLWLLGRLERIHGGAEIQYAPNPSWLEAP